MLFIISPSKSLDFDVSGLPSNFSLPIFLKDSEELAMILKKLSPQNLMNLMEISENLAELNYQRYQNFKIPFNQHNSKPALFVFSGDVYDGIDEKNYSDNELNFAQNNLRILSGLYGVLRPLDLIQPYRLEMGINLKNKKGKNLYQFWQKPVTDYFNSELKNRENKILINLASDEYFKVVKPSLLNGKVINIIFKTNKNEIYKNIGFSAKKARGLMVNFAVKNNIKNPEELKSFDVNGYKFKKEFSDDFNWHFYN